MQGTLNPKGKFSLLKAKNQRGILLDLAKYDTWDEFTRTSAASESLLESKFIEDYEMVSDTNSDIEEQKDQDDDEFVDDDAEELPETQPIEWDGEFVGFVSKRRGDFMKKSIRLKGKIHSQKEKITVRKRKNITFGTSVHEPSDEPADGPTAEPTYEPSDEVFTQALENDPTG